MPNRIVTNHGTGKLAYTEYGSHWTVTGADRHGQSLPGPIGIGPTQKLALEDYQQKLEHQNKRATGE